MKNSYFFIASIAPDLAPDAAPAAASFATSAALDISLAASLAVSAAFAMSLAVSLAASAAGAGAAAGAAAGAGVGAGFSPQAVKPTATSAAIRSERFIIFPLALALDLDLDLVRNAGPAGLQANQPWRGIICRFTHDFQPVDRRCQRPMVVAEIAGVDTPQISSNRRSNRLV